MYYVVDSAGQTAGPYSADWVRANARPGMLVSHQQRWLAYSTHPDFQGALPPPPPMQGTYCPQCHSMTDPSVRFCRKCGYAQPNLQQQRNTPSPHVALLNLLIPGLGQMILGQVSKGLLILGIIILSLGTVVVPLIVNVAGIIDAYMVGSKLRRTGSVASWELFPS